MRHSIFHFILALLTAPSSSLDSSEEGVTLDLDSIRNAAQILNVLQQVNERRDAPPRPYKHHLKQQGLEKPSGIDLDYMGYSGEQYIDVNRLLQLVQKNYEANQNGALARSQKPRFYFISNPEVLDEYWRDLKNRASLESHHDNRNEYGAGMNTNFLNYIISQRRDGDDEEDHDHLHQSKVNSVNQFRTISPNDEQENLNRKAEFGLQEAAFKSRDDYDEGKEKKSPNKRTTFNYKIPVKVTRNDADIRKSIEEVKSSWKMKKSSRFYNREPVRTTKRYNDLPERSRYSRPRYGKESGRSNMGSNYGGYAPYGRTPVPFIGKRGIYEED